MGDEIKQLIDMVAKLKITVDEGFNRVDHRFMQVDERFDKIDEKFERVDRRFRVEDGLHNLNKTQEKILHSMKVFKDDIENNRKHIERLENRELYL